MPEIRVAVAARNRLGEGPVWSERTKQLVWTDIEGRRVWTLDPATGNAASVPAPDRVGCLALRPDGRLLLGLPDRLALWEPGAETAETEVVIPHQAGHVRTNDGRCDRQGRLVFGTMDEGLTKPTGTLWRYDGGGRLVRLRDGMAISNSVCFSPDGRTIYFADTPERCIRAADYDPATGAMSNERVFARVAQGNPDGSTVDADGYLWNAAWGAGLVTRYRPDGVVDRQVEVPARQPSSVAFGGPDFATLFVTTASITLDPPGPHDGALLAFEPGVRGLPEPEFTGAAA